MDGMFDQKAQRISVVIKVGEVAAGAIYRHKREQGQEHGNHPNGLVALKLKYYFFMFHCLFHCEVFALQMVVFLQLSYRIFKLASPVFVVLKKVETGAGRREQDCIAFFPEVVRELYGFFH